MKAHGEAGLSDRPRIPRRSPKATPREVVPKILYLRQRYHFGPGRIADYLERFHQLHVATSTVHRILIRHGLNRLPANQKRQTQARAWRRYEKPQPGHRLQLDVKVPERIAGTQKRLYQFTAIDDCTRILESLDIRHVYIRPRTPHLNGKVERSHWVDEQEFYQLLDKDGIADDIHLFNGKLREWEDYYTYHRPHGALDGQTPYERLMAKSKASLSPKS
jgi:transposase InsO family protein